ncbi:MAG: prepilin-type N-terminal cleavage/methylation domain-containing protein [Gemmatimonadales bacterium]
MKISLRISRRNTCGTPAANRGPRKGFALVEVIVAMVLLAVTVSALAPLMYSVSRSTMKVTGNVYRNGVVMQEVNRLVALPYDSLPVGTSSYSVSTGAYAHTRVVTISEPVAKLKIVKIVVTPVNLTYKPDTVVFNRTKARTSKYLCTICQ